MTAPPPTPPDLASLPLFDTTGRQPQDEPPAHPPATTRQAFAGLASPAAAPPASPHLAAEPGSWPAAAPAVDPAWAAQAGPPPRHDSPGRPNGHAATANGHASHQPAAAAPDTGGKVDWQLVASLRGQASERLSGEISDRPWLTEEQQHATARRIIGELLDDEDATAMVDADERRILSLQARTALMRATMDALFGLGRLQPLVEMDDVSNIEIYGADNVWIERSGGWLERVDAVAASDEELIDTIAFIGARSRANERPFSPAHPTLHLRLDGGARLAAMAWVTPRPVVTIRLHRLRDDRLTDLVAKRMLAPSAASFLAAAVRAQKSIVVAGSQGAGKTTCARALAAEIPWWEKIGTAETEFELFLDEMPDRHPRCISVESRPGSGERRADGTVAGEYTLDAAIYDLLRHNLQRILVGEVRGREVTAMLKAMQSGAGSISTTHAHSGEATIGKLVTCVMEIGQHATESYANRQIADHIDLIVFLGFETVAGDDGQPRRHRYVREILAVEPGERHGHVGYPATTHIYAPGPDGRAVPGLLNEEMRQLAGHGFDIDEYYTAGGARPAGNVA